MKQVMGSVGCRADRLATAVESLRATDHDGPRWSMLLSSAGGEGVPSRSPHSRRGPHDHSENGSAPPRARPGTPRAGRARTRGPGHQAGRGVGHGHRARRRDVDPCRWRHGERQGVGAHRRITGAHGRRRRRRRRGGRSAQRHVVDLPVRRASGPARDLRAGAHLGRDAGHGLRHLDDASGPLTVLPRPPVRGVLLVRHGAGHRALPARGVGASCPRRRCPPGRRLRRRGLRVGPRLHGARGR